MPCRCDLTGARVLYGNKVSHSQRKTRKRFEINLKRKKFESELTGEKYRLRVVCNAIRTVEKTGGFDAYMIKVADNMLSLQAQKIKKMIVTKYKEKTAG